MGLYRTRYHIEERNKDKPKLTKEEAEELIRAFASCSTLQQEFKDMQKHKTVRINIEEDVISSLDGISIPDMITFMFNRADSSSDSDLPAVPIEQQAQAQHPLPAVSMIDTLNPTLQQYPDDYIAAAGLREGHPRYHFFLKGELEPDPLCPHCGQKRDMDIPNVVIGENEFGKILQCKRLYCPSGGRLSLILP